MQPSGANPTFTEEEDRALIVALVKQLLYERPSDPVPFMYSYLKQVSEGVQQPVMPTNLEVAEMKNLRKKYDFLKGQLNEDEDCTDESEPEDDSDEEETKAPVKRPAKARAGVSAEVFGEHNKKEDFTPPVVPKS